MTKLFPSFQSKQTNAGLQKVTWLPYNYKSAKATLVSFHIVLKKLIQDKSTTDKVLVSIIWEDNSISSITRVSPR